ncbi:unnamed protein product [Bemisia tabaci]|uniref:DNA repair protein XRCC2 n=1 Tax=Bemisia tabaci TaxID=7038 RepID=A0A9P0AKF2_BEMTA|nr:unnamed protein product [Bemisia tabaci]
MNYHLKAESGVQLLARLNSHQSTAGLEEHLFHSGPEPKETIEIKGGPSTGKTLLLTQFIMKSILPPMFKDIKLNGLNVGVILIETDSHFNILKLVNLMERFILKKSTSKGITIEQEDIENLIKSSLNNLFLLTCHSSPELFVTFHQIPSLLIIHPSVSLILLDSVAAFYQQDVRSGGIRKIDLYCRKLVQVLQKCVNDYNVTTIYTKPSFFQSKSSILEEFSVEPKVGKINRRIELKFHESESNMFVATIQNSNSSTQVMYTINNQGLKWIKMKTSE